VKTRYVAYATALAIELATVTVVAGFAAPAAAESSSSSSGSASSSSKGDAVGSAVWGDVAPGAAEAALTRYGVWSAARDSGSLYALAASEGIHDVWAAGVTGKGVTVAVIDTGIAPVAGLHGARVINGPDLSLDAQTGLPRYLDGFGHGTHLAGIIAGRDEWWNPRVPDPSRFAGVAPDARLLNMKVGASDGGADVSQVIAAVDWVTQHGDDNGMNVRVISLAYGTASVQPWQVDPLAHAVENAWRAGIVVVAAAGNDGLGAPSLLMPALDPRVIAVGASDPMGTPIHSDDVVADFTSGGDVARRPDVVAPGRSVVSLRVPRSYADTMSPEGRVRGDISRRLFRGSGTSQATAFVAGEVALLLSARPELTPDQVKALLIDTAQPLSDGHPAQGAGRTDLRAALSAPAPSGGQSSLPVSTGTGSLELSRGGEHVVDPATGAVLTGERDILGSSWSGVTWSTASSTGRSWTRGTWNGRTWTGDGFRDNAWTFVPWSGTSWSDVPWTSYLQNSVQWVSRSWRGSNWESRSWREESWLSRSWRALY
jgi:serine protease AprX